MTRRYVCPRCDLHGYVPGWCVDCDAEMGCEPGAWRPALVFGVAVVVIVAGVFIAWVAS